MAENIGIIGTGYVGLVTGNCLASAGNKVWCIDIDETKVEKLKKSICTIYEPGLEKLLADNVKNETIYFSTKLEECVQNCDIIFLCLPTPPNEDGSADLHYVLQMADELGLLIKEKGIKGRKIIINKSTVPVGTAEKTSAILAKYLPQDAFVVVSNPEFLREGVAVEDSMKPERIVIGTDNEWAKEKLQNLYKPFVRSGNPIIFMSQKSAEVTKYAANSFLATKISFMNDISTFCERVGADIEDIRKGIATDSRIGKQFLYPGIGYGGSCFPKDVKALIYLGIEAGTPLSIVEAAQSVNYAQTERFIQKIITRFPDLKNKKIAIWGLAFKPNTDDIREAPALKVIDALLKQGAKITAYDPEATENVKAILGDKITFAERMNDVLDDVETLVICTEWSAFRNPDFDLLKSKMKQYIIFDGRNIFEPKVMTKLGFEYHCVGR